MSNYLKVALMPNIYNRVNLLEFCGMDLFKCPFGTLKACLNRRKIRMGVSQRVTTDKPRSYGDISQTQNR